MSLALIIAAVTAILSGAAVVHGVFQAWLSLRAEWRAREVLSHKLSTDPELLKYATASSSRALSETELAAATEVIAKSLGELSDQDRSRIAQGLRQPSKSGEQRFVQELIRTG